MTIEEIIASLEDQAQDKDRSAGGDPDSIFTADAAALIEAANILRRQNTTPPNNPLTLEELREIYAIGPYGADYLKPVWIECKRYTPFGSRYSGYDLIGVENDLIISMCDRYLYIPDYGDEWLAYRRKPEEGTT